MRHLQKTLRQVLRRERAFLLAAIIVTSLSLLLVAGTPAHAEQPPAVFKDGNLAQSQVYNGDLEVERGQVLRGDVVVYSGDVHVRNEGRIEGTLTVYSGDIDIEEGGAVSGNITSWSGDVQVDGTVGGSISAMAGDVEIGGTASIGGDISVMAGDIKQRAGASVGGSVLRGPELSLPSAPAVDWLPGFNADQEANTARETAREGARGFLAGMVVRGLSALLLLGLFVGGAASVAALRPAWTAELHGVLRRQSALAFAAGLIANVLLLAVIGFLYITVCLRPPALLLMLGLLVLNAAGMAAVGAEIGGRASERLSGRWTPTARVALGVLLPGVVIAFLWTLGGCFTFFGGLGALLLGSFGVGTILVKALNLGAGPASAARTAGPAAPTAAATSAATPPAAATPTAANTAGAETPAATVPASASAPPVEETAPATPVAAPETSAPAADISAAEAPPSSAAAAGEPAAPVAWWQESVAEASAPVEPPAAAPAAPLSTPAADNLAAPVDFTMIEGIGPKLSQRLHAANIRTFADLAGLPPETLAGILGWSSERVLRSNVLDRARRLATE